MPKCANVRQLINVGCTFVVAFSFIVGCGYPAIPTLHILLMLLNQDELINIFLFSLALQAIRLDVFR